MRSHLWAVFALSGVVLPTLLFVGACAAPEETAPAAPTASEDLPVVQVETPRPARRGPTIVTSGRLTYDDEIELAFSSSGIVEAVLVDAGDPVRQGQELSRLDITKLTADHEAARQERLQAERQAARLERLLSDSVSTLESAEQARTLLQVAATRERVAKADLERAVLTAPASGRVLRRLVDPGETVSAGRSALILGAGSGHLIVRTEVTGRDVVRLQVGDSADVVFDAFPARVFPAVVSDVAYAARPDNGMFEIEIAIRASATDLRPGLAARVRIMPSAEVALYELPIEALVSARDGSGSIFVAESAEGDVATIRELGVRIESLTTAGVLVAVEQTPGSVVVGGGEGLAEGDRVRMAVRGR